MIILRLSKPDCSTLRLVQTHAIKVSFPPHVFSFSCIKTTSFQISYSAIILQSTTLLTYLARWVSSHRAPFDPGFLRTLLFIRHISSQINEPLNFTYHWFAPLFFSICCISLFLRKSRFSASFHLSCQVICCESFVIVCLSKWEQKEAEESIYNLV